MKKVLFLTLFASLLVDLPNLPTQRKNGPESRPMNVVLITSDTTRAQNIPAYGCPLGRMPSLDRLAKEGTSFQMVSVANTTIPSHASMLTGLFPDRNNMISNETPPLPPNVIVLAEILRQRGYDCRAFVSSCILDILNRGFQEFDAPSDVNEIFWTESEQTTNKTLAFLDQRKTDRPFYLWAHIFDPHYPYDPAPPFNRMFADIAGNDPPFDFVKTGFLYTSGWQPNLPAHYGLSQYLGELAYWDTQLGRIIREIKKVDNTLLIFVADHGENLGEGGLWGHLYVNEQTLNVPLVLWHSDKGIVPAGCTSSFTAQQVDILPTVLDALGMKRVALDGESLLPYLRGPARNRLAYSFATGAGAVTVTDSEKGLRLRQRLVQNFEPEAVDTSCFSFSQFSDTVMEHRGIRPIIQSDGKYLAPYSAQVRLPGVDEVEYLLYTRYWDGRGSLQVWSPLFAGGKFSCEKDFRFDNFFQIYGENRPFAASNFLYAVRLLRNKEVLWVSPWIPCQEDFDGNHEVLPESERARLIDIYATGNEELGRICSPDDPKGEALRQAMKEFLQRQGGLLAKEEAEKSFFYAAENVLRLPASQKHLRTPDEAYTLYQKERDNAESAVASEEHAQALRALGYL